MIDRVAQFFDVRRLRVDTTVQGSISVGACKFFLLHFLRNGRVGENIIPVRRIGLQSCKAVRVLGDFGRIVGNVFGVVADIGVLDGLFGFQSINVGLVGGDAVCQRGISRRKLMPDSGFLSFCPGLLLLDKRFYCVVAGFAGFGFGVDALTQRGIGGFAGCFFGGVCRLIGRVKLRNSLLAVGGLLRNSSGVCLFRCLRPVDFLIELCGEVSDGGSHAVNGGLPLVHLSFPLNNLFVPAVNQFGETFVVLLELLNQSGQVKDGFLQVCELIVVVSGADPVFRLVFGVLRECRTFRHIALAGVHVAVVHNNGQGFVLPLVVPLHGIREDGDIARADVHASAALIVRRGARMRRASMVMMAVTARRMRCAGNGEVITVTVTVTVCHNENAPFSVVNDQMTKAGFVRVKQGIKVQKFPACGDICDKVSVVVKAKEHKPHHLINDIGHISIDPFNKRIFGKVACFQLCEQLTSCIFQLRRQSIQTVKAGILPDIVQPQRFGVAQRLLELVHQPIQIVLVMVAGCSIRGRCLKNKRGADIGVLFVCHICGSFHKIPPLARGRLISVCHSAAQAARQP